MWKLPKNFPLNQGNEGACVAFGWSAELACEPVEIDATNASARKFYKLAQKEDKLMGNDWDEGASVLAGARVAKKLGLISEYRWAFNTSQIIDAVISHGPVVIGIPWFNSMYRTEAGGLVTISGELAGYHCLVVHGYWPNHPRFGMNVLDWTNSWGPDYGVNGVGSIREHDLAYLLKQQGEACIATDLAPKSALPWWQRSHLLTDVFGH